MKKTGNSTKIAMEMFQSGWEPTYMKRQRRATASTLSKRATQNRELYANKVVKTRVNEHLAGLLVSSNKTAY